MYKYYKNGVNCKYSVFVYKTAHVGGIITYSLTIIELTLFGNDPMNQGTGLVTTQGKANLEDEATSLLLACFPGWLILESLIPFSLKHLR
jgi:hypothetical protein